MNIELCSMSHELQYHKSNHSIMISKRCAAHMIEIYNILQFVRQFEICFKSQECERLSFELIALDLRNV